VQHWLSLSDTLGDSNSQREELTVQNDNGITFDEIADFIESKPDGLFTA